MEHSKENLRKEKARTSAFGIMNPAAKKHIDLISNFISKSDTSSAISILRIENMATILFTYGLKIRNMIEKDFEDRIQELLPNALVLRMDLDHIIIVTKKRSKGIFLKTLDDFIFNIASFGTENKETPIFFNVKIGSSIIKKEENISDKLEEAFIALHESLSSGRTRHILFDTLSQKLLQFQIDMKKAAFLQDAIKNKRLSLAYQPVVDATTGVTKSYEVLLRIICEDGTLISAGEYIQIAEKYGFIDKIDIHVLEMAATELRDFKEISLGINVSNVSIDDGKWIERAKVLLSDYNDASRLIVEITETGIQESLETILEFVDEVESLGCKIAIDDFGAGHTSFTQLKTIQADFLKIDGAFVKDLTINPDSQLFVKTMIDFSKAFGLKTIAEFVENGAIAKILMDLGVDYMQGFYFSKPMNYRPWAKED